MTELKDFYDLIDFLSNSSSLYLNLKTFKIQFPIKSVKEALDDTADVETILNDLFYRKQVMWEHHKYENLDWCLNSLKELKDKCDDFSDNYFRRKSSNKDKNQFLASILKTWGSYADEAAKDIIKSDLTDRSLKSILKSFRKKSYPIIVIFIYSLPDGNPTKDTCLKKLEKAWIIQV
ncbi:MAG: hypothetical protein R2825_21790 [Saprospiraceae bacterium]